MRVVVRDGDSEGSDGGAFVDGADRGDEVMEDAE